MKHAVGLGVAILIVAAVFACGSSDPPLSGGPGYGGPSEPSSSSGGPPTPSATDGAAGPGSCACAVKNPGLTLTIPCGITECSDFSGKMTGYKCTDAGTVIDSAPCVADAGHDAS